MKMKLIVGIQLMALCLLVGCHCPFAKCCKKHEGAKACAAKPAEAAVTATGSVNATGTWKWTFSGPNGQTRESTLKLNVADGKLTGTISGRQGAETAIENATLSGDDIAFTVTRERDGRKMTAKYAGKISGDVIKGKIERDFGGQPQTRDWEAKKQ